MNTQRNSAADLLKGSAVILMVQVHVMELFARQPVFDSAVGMVSTFLGGPAVAPVFLAVMGYFVAGSTKTTRQLILRGIGLMGVGILLNVGLNAHLLLKIHRGLPLSPWEFLFGVDILFVAGVGTVLLALAKPVFKDHPAIWATVTMLIAACAPVVADSLTTESQFRWVFAYVGGNYWWSYFPLFPWLAYPALGFTVHVAIQWWRNKVSLGTDSRINLIYKPIGAALVVLLVATGRHAITVCHDLPRYYHHGFGFFAWVCAFLTIWVAIHQFVDQRFGERAVLMWLKSLGSRVTVCYAIQWLIIGNIATAIYKTETLVHCGLWIVTILVAVSLLIKLMVYSAGSRGGSTNGGVR